MLGRQAFDTPIFKPIELLSTSRVRHLSAKKKLDSNSLGARILQSSTLYSVKSVSQIYISNDFSNTAFASLYTLSLSESKKLVKASKARPKAGGRTGAFFLALHLLPPPKLFDTSVEIQATTGCLVLLPKH